MHLVYVFIACVGLFVLFPKAFKYLVGTWIGVSVGGLAWCTASLAFFPTFFSPGGFLGFIVAGIVGGCILAAKG